jgi:RNA polymerase sigma-70 factor (ECF subfamily)
VARRYRARAAREQQQAAGDAELTHDRAPERELAQQERWQLAQQALATLDDDKREVFVLSQVEQMSAPEIAAIVGVPVNTVYSRLRAARLAFDAFAARVQRSERGGAR